MKIGKRKSEVEAEVKKIRRLFQGEASEASWKQVKKIRRPFQHEIASLSLLTIEKQKWAWRPTNS